MSIMVRSLIVIGFASRDGNGDGEVSAFYRMHLMNSYEKLKMNCMFRMFPQLAIVRCWNFIRFMIAGWQNGWMKSYWLHSSVHRNIRCKASARSDARKKESVWLNLHDFTHTRGSTVPVWPLCSRVLHMSFQYFTCSQKSSNDGVSWSGVEANKVWLRQGTRCTVCKFIQDRVKMPTDSCDGDTVMRTSVVIRSG